jgi:hypothetical protein
MPDAHASNQRPQIKAGEYRRNLLRKWILAVFVVIVTASYIVPERVKKAVVVRLPGVRAQRRVWVGRYVPWLSRWKKLLFAGRGGFRGLLPGGDLARQGSGR